jgi:hypothetical protein
MALRACEKCHEMADEAKAFCPSCGHAFVDEQKREKPSEFDSMDGTMQFGKTMYNQMLSDMGLNINAAPSGAEKPKTQVITAAPLEPKSSPAVPPPVEAAPADEKRRNKLLIFGIIAAFLILGLLIVLAAAFVLWTRFG